MHTILREKRGHFAENYYIKVHTFYIYFLCRLFVYILLTFYVFSSLLFSKILLIFSSVICVHSTNIK